MKCFVIALDNEAEPILSAMQETNQKIVCGKKLWTGKMCGEDTALLICGVGKVNAACGAQYVIDALNADCIINVGLSGALSSSCNVADIYEIDRAVQYDFDLVQLNGTEIGTLNEFEDRWLKIQTAGIFPAKSLATGDRFNDCKADFELLTGDLHADVRDMEGAAMAQVCIHAGIPFYSFKAISDIAGSGSTTDQYIANTSICAKALKASAEKIFSSVKVQI
ncbi:MAG: 5'-methylthioadenosine/S-adenosylhomocysteine nucleosidase [Clostridia bacterium]|nr:5'-methylthioadenosine/S-adenosylhomocysteine nucleosidase [Clostridia bacterium]